MSLKNKKPLLWAEVDLDHLRSNLREVRSALSFADTDILAVVKADAYGHGMRAVARVLAKEGIRFFGVANLAEALELRKICPKARILVLGNFHKTEIPSFVRHRITPSLSCIEDARLFEKYLARSASNIRVHVKIDTGMGRLGINLSEVGYFFKKIKKMRSLEVEGVYTHFSCAGDADERFTHAQIERFHKAVQKIKHLGFAPKYLHAANSMGFARFGQAHLNLVRPGIILYGINPSPNIKLPIKLKPILSLKTRIAFLKTVKRGVPLSYSATYKAPRTTRIATLPVGYSHGYRVGFSNRGFVAVRGRKCPVVGRVTMDQTLVDVGRVPGVRRWDEVLLIGEDGKATITAHDLSALIQTIPYEILCSIHSRIPRIYKGLN